MKNLILNLFIFFIIINGCTDPISSDPKIEKLIFVACEGNFGASNGSINILNDNGDVTKVEEIGDVVQSLEVYKNKLIVLINNMSSFSFSILSDFSIFLCSLRLKS